MKRGTGRSDEGMNTSDYIRFDECQDVLSSLEQCAFSLAQVRQLSHAWKWVVISLHSALQGAMVCHLSGTAKTGALTKDSAKKRLEWSRSFKDKDPGVVTGARELFNRVSDSSSRLEKTDGEEISVTDEHKKAFERLHNLRNEFSHFGTKLWSIEIAYIEEIIEPVLDILCLIAADDWSFRRMPEEGEEIRRAIEKVRSTVA